VARRPTHVSASHLLLGVRGWEQGAWGRSDTDSLSVLGAVVHSSGSICCLVCAFLGVIMHGVRRWLGGAQAHTRVCVSPFIECERLGARCLGKK
jgi:hypothetical protein